MKSFVARSRWAAIGAAVAVSLGGGAVFVANAATSADYVSIEPCRLLDTRPAPDRRGIAVPDKIGPTSPIGSNQLLNNDITIYFDDAATDAQMGECDSVVLSGVDPKAVHITVTVPFAVTDTFVTVYPWEFMDGDFTTDASNRPYVSLMNPWKSNHAFSNTANVGLEMEDGTGKRAFRIYNHVGRVDVVVDVLGYFK